MASQRRKGALRKPGLPPLAYFEAAIEHQAVAEKLHAGGDHALAIYIAGLTAECLFRAYHSRFSSQFDERHNLKNWWKKSRFVEELPRDREKAARYEEAMATLAANWENAHRYRSERALREFFKGIRADRTVSKGDYLKELSRRVVNASNLIVQLGVIRWER